MTKSANSLPPPLSVLLVRVVGVVGLLRVVRVLGVNRVVRVLRVRHVRVRVLAAHVHKTSRVVLHRQSAAAGLTPGRRALARSAVSTRPARYRRSAGPR